MISRFKIYAPVLPSRDELFSLGNFKLLLHRSMIKMILDPESLAVIYRLPRGLLSV